MKRKHKINHDFFNVWSSDMAYILGFWWADGWIDKNGSGHKFCISQAKNNSYILNRILKKMDSDYPVIERKWGVCYFAIQSRPIVENIESLGGKENKSLDVKFPNVPSQYLHDFVRGYFDGDGCICESKDRRREGKTNFSISFTSGSKELLDGLLKELRKNICGFNGYICRKKEKTKTANSVIWKHDNFAYVLFGASNDARRLKDFMYRDEKELRLNGKYEKFRNIGEIHGLYLKSSFVTFSSCLKVTKLNEFKNYWEWKNYAREHKELPICPQKVYKEQWKGWKHFLHH